MGASSGMGAAVARRLSVGGCAVALVARREAHLAELAAELNASAHPAALASAYVHDVTDSQAAGPLFERIVAAMDGVDLVVYAAGIMPAVGQDEYPTDRDIPTIQTNFAGAVAWLNPAADRFSRLRSGTIIAISSVAGDRGRRGHPVYEASKAALDSYLDSLRARLGVRGVTIVTIKPGYVRTPMTQGATFLLPAVSADQAAEQMLSAAAAGKRVVYVPGWWRPIMAVIKAIPAPIFERLPIP